MRQSDHTAFGSTNMTQGGSIPARSIPRDTQQNDAPARMSMVIRHDSQDPMGPDQG
ncbi:MAG: hypothetical protein M3R08_09420 [Bacteroidota bacterium]|nr:hypothetical protein [Bacteroidota bacterium]